MTADVVRYEWAELQQIAAQLGRASMVPAAYRNRPENIILVALTGQELGWGLTTAMRFVQVVEGRPTVSPEGMLALVRRAGHRVCGQSTARSATITGTRKDTGDEMTVTFTLEDAERADLLRKDNWRHYPEAMLWARALSVLCRRLFSDVLLGAAYVPEEMGADTDADGNVIDVVSVEMPSRPVQPAPPAGPPEDDPVRMLFARLKGLAGLPVVAELNELAELSGRRLTPAAFHADPAWCEQVTILVDGWDAEQAEIADAEYVYGDADVDDPDDDLVGVE